MKVKYTYSPDRITFEPAINPMYRYHLLLIETENGENVQHIEIEPLFEHANNKGEIEVLDKLPIGEIFTLILNQIKKDENGL